MPPIYLSEDVIRVFVAHDWPGQVRELENTIRAAAIQASHDSCVDGLVIMPEHLDEEFKALHHAPAVEKLDVSAHADGDSNGLEDAIKALFDDRDRAQESFIETYGEEGLGMSLDPRQQSSQEGRVRQARGRGALLPSLEVLSHHAPVQGERDADHGDSQKPVWCPPLTRWSNCRSPRPGPRRRSSPLPSVSVPPLCVSGRTTRRRRATPPDLPNSFTKKGLPEREGLFLCEQVGCFEVRCDLRCSCLHTGFF